MWGKCMITKNQRGTWHVHLWNGCESYRLCLPFIFIRWMQDWVSHYCDKMMFFVRLPFIQMCTVINISLDLLIETWIKTTISLWKQLCGHLLIKKLIVWTFEIEKCGLVVQLDHHKMKFFLTHIPNLLLQFNI